MFYTVFGGKGFIGGHIVRKLKEDGNEVSIPQKNDRSIYGKELGNVIYCAGLTSDFRQRPFDTVEAHVCYLSEVLKNAIFNSFTYISSTRVYFNSRYAVEEGSLKVNPNNLDDIFNISKLMGESLCLSCKKENIKIVRVSNVCGRDFASDNFLYSIIKDAFKKREIVLNTTLDSEKDYIGIDDVTNMIIDISNRGKSKIYNLANGENISNADIVNIIKAETNCNIVVSENAKSIKFPKIQIGKLKEEFDFKPIEGKELVKELVLEYKEEMRQ